MISPEVAREALEHALAIRRDLDQVKLSAQAIRRDMREMQRMLAEQKAKRDENA